MKTIFAVFFSFSTLLHAELTVGQHLAPQILSKIVSSLPAVNPQKAFDILLMISLYSVKRHSPIEDIRGGDLGAVESTPHDVPAEVSGLTAGRDGVPKSSAAAAPPRPDPEQNTDASVGLTPSNNKRKCRFCKAVFTVPFSVHIEGCPQKPDPNAPMICRDCHEPLTGGVSFADHNKVCSQKPAGPEIPLLTCSVCGVYMRRNDFSISQRRKGVDDRCCQTCAEAKVQKRNADAHARWLEAVKKALLEKFAGRPLEFSDEQPSE